MKRKAHFIFLLVWGAISMGPLTAQEQQIALQEVNEDDLGNVTDAFQENFFEALKQKGIENYEKAIQALEICKKIEPNNPVVYFELGKNYKQLEKYDEAVENLQKANRIKPNQEWVMAELMETYYATRDFDSAIIVAKKLASFNSNYQNNLADLYFKSQQYDKLITLLDELDAKLGVTEFRLSLRQQIYAITNNTSAQIKAIKDAIKVNPENESNYLQLIFVYSEEGMEEQAFKAAKDMLTNFPTSKVVHLALYKFYLDSNEPGKAVESMKIVFETEEIDAQSKFKVLSDFLLFVNENPTYEDDLNEVVALFSSVENNPGVYKKLGEYFLLKNEKQRALEFFEQGIMQDLDNMELLTNTLLLQMDQLKYKEASNLSELGLEIFPAQPVLYLIRGISLNKLQEFNEAIEMLTFGLDYVIDNAKLTGDFYQQLSIAYTGTNNEKKALEFREKADEINKTLN